MPNKPWVDKMRNPPIQYERGWTEFYKLKFKLTPDVLIPRPETELLVDEVLRILNSEFRIQNEGNNSELSTRNSEFKVLDVGTGSGCIAISIAKNAPNVKVFALDISEEALQVAEQNSKFHHTEKKVMFIKSDLLSMFCHPEAPAEGSPDENAQSADSSGRTVRYIPQNDRKPQIDVIVANLPYIPSARLMLIDPMVRDFEPKLALDGGSDGFELYRTMFSQMRNNNFYPKYLIAEIDEEQGDIAKQEVKRYFPEAEIEIKKDLFKKDRILRIKF